MLETPPILSYSSPARRPRFWALAGTLLIMWGIVDVVLGLFGTVASGSALLFAETWYLFSPLFVAALALLCYGLYSCELGYGILRQNATSLRRAIALTLVVEVIAWIAMLTVLAFTAHDRHRFSKPRLSEIALDSLALLLPAAITATRLLLCHAARFSPASPATLR